MGCKMEKKVVVEYRIVVLEKMVMPFYGQIQNKELYRETQLVYDRLKKRSRNPLKNSSCKMVM